jgi:hypothetical protein
MRQSCTTLDPKTLIYRSQKLKVRATRVIEAVERLLGARPGQKLEVNFRAATLESALRQAGRRLALGLTAGAAGLATGLTALSTGVAGWVPVSFGVIRGCAHRRAAHRLGAAALNARRSWPKPGPSPAIREGTAYAGCRSRMHPRRLERNVRAGALRHQGRRLG